MINPDNRLKLTVSYRTAELPYLAQWKMMGRGEYVMGLEPANCFPEGQENFEKRGLLKNKFENPFRTRETWAISDAAHAGKRNTDVANVLGGSFSKDGNRGAR